MGMGHKAYTQTKPKTLDIYDSVGSNLFTITAMQIPNHCSLQQRLGDPR